MQVRDDDVLDVLWCSPHLLDLGQDPLAAAFNSGVDQRKLAIGIHQIGVDIAEGDLCEGGDQQLGSQGAPEHLHQVPHSWLGSK